MSTFSYHPYFKLPQNICKKLRECNENPISVEGRRNSFSGEIETHCKYKIKVRNCDAQELWRLLHFVQNISEDKKITEGEFANGTLATFQVCVFQMIQEDPENHPHKTSEITFEATDAGWDFIMRLAKNQPLTIAI